MSTVRIGRDDSKPSRHSHHDHDPLGHLHVQYERRHKISVPTIPDLRFEHTYLKNIRQHVHVKYMQTKSISDVTGKSEAQESSQGTEVVHVAWGKVLWITVREQVIGPLAQGLLWGVLRWYCLPSAAIFGQNFRAWWDRGNTLASRHRGNRQTIDGVRNWVFSKPS
ncbi:uncharacterized protein PHACADRAFT_251182 [Phanerochaete carnosa HHB-10118-sp]|uniref:Uncharacterized protein n=1 Tax=Phanerochaete carnosa (strain HHB-10118-sp) TaxID=650164 RepID=K5V4H4_PHACS|nr:uncharacterized protein PHACADRAFT_251182 [Phanerochaete carnosa HHB-10118-sp]EKM57511.1 hypothetical protein PHACADRAFT_251182 [Phanerochaete carnosa HHB-10118-sp]